MNTSPRRPRSFRQVLTEPSEELERRWAGNLRGKGEEDLEWVVWDGQDGRVVVGVYKLMADSA